jgi:RNA polymerase sigma-70 factor, ECF subfamily
VTATTARGDFDSAYRAHLADVRRFVSHFVQDASLADELAQDAFVKALDAWDRYRGEAPERIWLLRIARNVCLDYLRSPRSRITAADSQYLADAAVREPASDLPPTAGRPLPLSVEQTAVQAEMSECVQRFVLSLPESLRTPLILHDMQGLTNGEIAQVLCCSLEAAKMRLHRGRERLRQLMAERCDLYHDERNVLACLPTSKRSSGGE